MSDDEKETFDNLKNKLNSQDCNQKINLTISFLLQLYKVLVGSFLTVFVPQSCEGVICSMNQNIFVSSPFNVFVLAFNLFTFFSFMIMYYIELKRENKMIVYLDVNKNLPRNDESVANQLSKLPKEKLDNLYYYDKRYWQSSIGAFVTFTLNIIFSCIVIASKYLNSNSIIVLLTNILFIGSKLYTSYEVVNTSKNIFLSSYLTRKVQFNDVDPDKIEEEEDIQLEV
jgi:hypothetical protein